MDEMMNFPDNWHDFIKSNSFVDREEIYTNGARLMTELRVEQLVEHILREKEQQWISVKNKLPEKQGEYIAFDGKSVFGAYYERDTSGTKWTDTTEGYCDFNVTHWMPLPEPPKEG